MSNYSFPIAFTRTKQRQIDEEKRIDRATKSRDEGRLKGTIIKTEVVFHSQTGNPGLIVHVLLDKDVKANNFTPRQYMLRQPIDEIALVYGDTLPGRRCVIENSGLRETGYATVINDGELEDYEQNKKLKPFGTSMAPAGGGLL